MRAAWARIRIKVYLTVLQIDECAGSLVPDTNKRLFECVTGGINVRVALAPVLIQFFLALFQDLFVI